MADAHRTAPADGRTTARQSRFVRLAGWSYRRPWWALLAWAVVLVGVTAGSQAIGADYYNDFTLPGTESQQARDMLREQAPAQANDTVEIVLHDPAGLDTSDTEQRVAQMVGDVGGLPYVTQVTSPYDAPAAISADGTIGYATVALDGQAQDVPNENVRTLIDTAQAAAGDGLQVELGGEAVRSAEEGGGPPAELAGLVAALVILVVMFGSLLAASLPVVIAIFAVGSTLGLIALASHLATIADFTPPLMMLVGLGVGIDYALLVFARFRSELLSGEGRAQAVRNALDTAGRTIFFAGCIVIVALLGLVLLGLGALQGVAVALAVTVLVTMVAALTLLPAMLATAGRRIERVVQRRADRRARRRGADSAGHGGDRWRRWAALVQRRPWTAALVPTVALLALAAPALDMRLGFADAGNDPSSTTSRQAYDLLAQGFGPGSNGPLLVVAEAADGASGEQLATTLDTTDGVAQAFPAGGGADDGAGGDAVTTIVVLPETAPQAAETTELVQRLRTEVLPPLEAETGATFLVGGSTAAAVDFADAVADRLPLFIGAVVGMSALLLLVVFRSLLIPLKAIVFNVVSVGASLGAITLVFQHGVLADWFGATAGPVEAYLPVMIFAIIFGLSMDYEIFLLSRMHESWQRHRDAGRAIGEGLATTGRVVTAAAAIMIVVFGAFVLSPDRMLQQFGLGLAVAVFLDAVVVRCLLLPAVMQLFGARAWWLPRALARVVPRISLERS